MSSLLLLTACAAVPWLVCGALRATMGLDETGAHATRERTLGHYRRATLFAALLALPASAVAGALLVDPSLSTRWPTTGSWFFASLCTMTTWASLSLARRTREEAAAMTTLETVGRAVQMSSAPVLALGISLLGAYLVNALLPLAPLTKVVASSLLSVAVVIVVSPWMVVTLGLWPLLPKRVEADGASWRLAHLPAPTPFLTHAAALPWLQTALVSDGLFNRAPDRHWETLVRYEIGGAQRSRRERLTPWAIAIPSSMVVFMLAGTVGEGDGGKLVAANALAVLFTAAASWFANRTRFSMIPPDSGGPSMQELAQTLRSLPPCLGQALPRTSHRPLGSALYDRLFALGHDPGRRPHS